MINNLNIHTIFLLPSIFLFGMFIGNILNILATYLPYSLLKSQKAPNKITLQCEHCEFLFPPLIIVPFVRILLFKEVCNRCQTRFASRYLLTEIATALISVLLIYHLGLSWILLLYLILAWGFILLMIIDIEHYLLPDIITLPLLWLGLFSNTFSLFTTTQDAILGTIIGYLSLYTISKSFKYYRGTDGLGLGDCKLFAVFGAWWGIEILLPSLLVASLIGTTIGTIKMLLNKHNLETPIPFGPYLILGAVYNSLG